MIDYKIHINYDANIGENLIYKENQFSYRFLLIKNASDFD